MPNTFRVWRKADTGPPRDPRSQADGATRPDTFRAWSRACADLRHAEHLGDTDKASALAVAVMRAHNALTRERLSDGWEAPQKVLTDLERDEHLVDIHPGPDDRDV